MSCCLLTSSSSLPWFAFLIAVMEPHISGYIHRTLQHPSLRVHCGRRDWKIIRSIRSGWFLWVCLLIVPEATPIKSHPHNCPNVSWTRMKWTCQSGALSLRKHFFHDLRLLYNYTISLFLFLPANHPLSSFLPSFQFMTYLFISCC